MVYLSLLLHQKPEYIGSIPLTIGLFVSITVLVALCAKAKHSSKSKKLHSNPINSDEIGDLVIPPRSPLRYPKQLISSISDKALPLIYNHRRGKDDVEKGMSAAESDGSDGLWRKAILMGEKCQPPEFSGAIYYDYEGKRIPEMPRSPARANFKAAGLPCSFSFPVPVHGEGN